MKNVVIWWIGLAWAALLCVACTDKSSTGVVVATDEKTSVDKYAPYVEGNKKIMQWEKEEIDLFIKRYQWKMTQTGTGLYIEILNAGSGAPIKSEDEITMNYQTFLLTGEKIYDSEQDGAKTIKVDKSEEIDGLHEAAKLLHRGAKARLVIPSYLAYGVAGDGDKVVGREPIAMIIEIVS